ncbi:hypothetical protein UNSWDHB_1469 [Dehalobacter sp. UNSWDHB]|nr:hypothetical protein DHBDCA_p479 [Dehalobacter sp. DCA]AFV04541.1 hypothetical protein DCF50_p535 [Dehalobacter sp. CF]EQB21210.1 hypothetical protein UNSWDHB_1469 [Dehalobacter sp. UNSWDHB]
MCKDIFLIIGSLSKIGQEFIPVLEQFEIFGNKFIAQMSEYKI